LYGRLGGPPRPERTSPENPAPPRGLDPRPAAPREALNWLNKPPPPIPRRNIKCVKKRKINRLRNVLYWTRIIFKGIAVAQWLRCCATNRKVADSIPAGVSGFFIDN